MGAVSWCASNLRVVCAECMQQVMMWPFLHRLVSIGLRLTRWYWNIANQGETRTTNDMMKRAKGKELWDTANLKPDDFLYCSMSTWWGSSGLIGFLQILKGLEAEAAQDYEQFWGLRGPPRYGTCQKISPRRWPGILALAQWDYRLPFGNRKGGTVSPLFLLVSSMGRGWENSVCVSRV